MKAFVQDGKVTVKDEQWVTIGGEDEDGSGKHVLINGSGTIVAGFGKGKNVKNAFGGKKADTPGKANVAVMSKKESNANLKTEKEAIEKAYRDGVVSKGVYEKRMGVLSGIANQRTEHNLRASREEIKKLDERISEAKKRGNLKEAEELKKDQDWLRGIYEASHQKLHGNSTQSKEKINTPEKANAAVKEKQDKKDGGWTRTVREYVSPAGEEMKKIWPKLDKLNSQVRLGKQNLKLYPEIFSESDKKELAENERRAKELSERYKKLSEEHEKTKKLKVTAEEI